MPMGAKAVAVVHYLAVGVLAFLLFGRALHTFAPAFAKVVIAATAAFVFTRIYRAWEPARLFLTVSALASALFLALFLAKAPLGELATTDVQAAPMPKVVTRIPVVLVV